MEESSPIQVESSSQTQAENGPLPDLKRDYKEIVVGSKVTILLPGSEVGDPGEIVRATIVPFPTENTDEENFLFFMTPVAQAILGKTSGDKATVIIKELHQTYEVEILDVAA